MVHNRYRIGALLPICQYVVSVRDWPHAGQFTVEARTTARAAAAAQLRYVRSRGMRRAAARSIRVRVCSRAGVMIG